LANDLAVIALAVAEDNERLWELAQMEWIRLFRQ
jgi:hypothetical protein